MKIETIKKHILEVAHRDFRFDSWTTTYSAYFPNTKLVDFLAHVVANNLNLEIDYISSNNTIFCNLSFDLELWKRGKEYYLGSTLSKRRSLKNFDSIFSSIFRRNFVIELRASDGSSFNYHHLLSTQSVEKAIKKIVLKSATYFKHPYNQSLSKVLSRFANTHREIEIIVMDSKGDFYITQNRVWVLCYHCPPFLIFENTFRRRAFPDEINKGRYFQINKRILQIRYENKVLYSVEAFQESELYWRENHEKILVQAFCDGLKDKDL